MLRRSLDFDAIALLNEPKDLRRSSSSCWTLCGEEACDCAGLAPPFKDLAFRGDRLGGFARPPLPPRTRAFAPACACAFALALACALALGDDEPTPRGALALGMLPLLLPALLFGDAMTLSTFIQ